MTKNELYSKLFGFNASTYHRWRNEERPIIQLLHKYCDEKDLQEFIETGKISKLEKNSVKIDKYDNHILFHVIRKINEIPKLFLLGKKEFWLKGFIYAVKNCEEATKNELITQIENITYILYELLEQTENLLLLGKFITF